MNTTEEIVVCIGMDAFRIALGLKPRNYSADLVILWLTLMANPKFSGGIYHDDRCS